MLLLERGLMITSCCSEGPGCINMSRSNAAKVYAGSLWQKFGIDLSAFSLFLPLPTSTIKYFSGYQHLGPGPGEKLKGLGRALRCTVADLWFSWVLHVNSLLGQILVAWTLKFCVFNICKNKELLGPIPSWTALYERPFFPFFFLPSRYFSFS